MAEFEFQTEKLAQIVLMAVRWVNNGLLGKTKLYKLLYYVDFDHFEKHGVPVTGETYLRFEHGPVPQHGELTLRQLAETEQIRIDRTTIGNYLPFTYEPLVEPNPSVFAPEEMVTITEVLRKWEKHTATEMVAATHGEAPWVATAPNEPISYSLAYYRNKFGEMNQFAEEDASYTSDIAEVG